MKRIKVNPAKVIKEVNGYFYIRKYYKGVEIFESTKMQINNENRALLEREVERIVNNKFAKLGFKVKCELHTLDEYLLQTFDIYIESLQGKVKNSSIVRKKTILADLNSTILRHKRTCNMDVAALHDYAAYLHSKGKARNTILANITTLLSVINMWREAYNYPKITRKEVDIKGLGYEEIDTKPFSEKEAKLLLENADDSKELKKMLVIALNTGMRPGEMLALKVSDIDLDIGVIKVDKNLEQCSKDTTNPKTKSSARDIPFLYDEFREYMCDLVSDMHPNKRLFNINTFPRKEWLKLLKKCNMEHNKFYATRHTFASVALTKTKNYMLVSRILGHKNFNITYEHYSRYVKSDNEYINLKLIA